MFQFLGIKTVLHKMFEMNCKHWPKTSQALHFDVATLFFVGSLLNEAFCISFSFIFLPTAFLLTVIYWPALTLGQDVSELLRLTKFEFLGETKCCQSVWETTRPYAMQTN